jgi:hypothetical protein
MLKKINWKFRKTHIEISPLNIHINSKWDGWGFEILKIQHNLWEGSILKMVWELPNGAEKKLKFTGDFLFLRSNLLKELMDLEDRILWNSKFSKWDEIKYWTLNLIFK